MRYRIVIGPLHRRPGAAFVTSLNTRPKEQDPKEIITKSGLNNRWLKGAEVLVYIPFALTLCVFLFFPSRAKFNKCSVNCTLH